MKHTASGRFWALYDALPKPVRAVADKNFQLLKSDPRRKIVTWAVLVLSILAGAYASVSAIFYEWMSIVAPQRWPLDRATLWVYGSLALAILLLALFIYCVTSLIRDARRTSKIGRNAT